MTYPNYRRAGLGLTLAAAIVAVGTVAAPTPAHAINTGEAIGIGVGGLALGTMLGAASNPYAYGSPYGYGYSYAPAYSYAAPAPAYYYPPTSYYPSTSYYRAATPYYGSSYAPSYGYGWGY